MVHSVPALQATRKFTTVTVRSLRFGEFGGQRNPPTLPHAKKMKLKAFEVPDWFSMLVIQDPLCKLKGDL